jgi:hypothetical protein
MPIKDRFDSERELCQFFMEAARDQGWSVYPETAGYDILLVATDKVRGGSVQVHDQVGVEAKLRGNVTVLRQAMPSVRRRGSSPHFFSVLVPTASQDFKYVATQLGIVVFSALQPQGWRDLVKKAPNVASKLARHYRYEGAEPCWTPGMHIDIEAGVASPKSITPWKIAAVKLCLRAARYGTVTSADFRDAGISTTVFRTNGWIRPVGKAGRLLTYALNNEANPPHILYPEIAAAIAKEGSYL